MLTLIVSGSNYIWRLGFVLSAIRKEQTLPLKYHIHQPARQQDWKRLLVVPLSYS
jgi:hypothetical protein